MRITDVEAVVLRQAVLDEGIADGSQDDLVILIHTDEGITGIGEVDSAPEAVQALVQQRGSHAVATSLRDALVGEDPLDVERLWERMYRSVIYVGRRGIAIHAISGLDIALWDLKGKALGKPVCELIGTPVRDRIRAYASMLMPDTPEETAERVSALTERHFTAIKLGWGPLGKDPEHDVAARRRGEGGRGRRRRDPDRRRARLRRRRRCRDPRRARARGARDLLARGAVRARRVRGVREARRRSGDHDRRRRAGRDPLGLPRADRAWPRRPRPARRDALRRDHRDAADRRARPRARGRDGAARVEEWDHQGRLAARERRPARRPLPGVLRGRHRDQHPTDEAAPPDRAGRLRRDPDRRPASASTSTRTSSTRCGCPHDLALVRHRPPRRARHGRDPGRREQRPASCPRARGARRHRDERLHVHRLRGPHLHGLPRRLRAAAPRPQRPGRRRGGARTHRA